MSRRGQRSASHRNPLNAARSWVPTRGDQVAIIFEGEEPGDDDTVRFAREPSALRELSHSGIRRHVADGVTEAVLGSPALL